MKRTIIFCGMVGALLFIATAIYGGLQIEGYDFVTQFISESYATGIPDSEKLQYAYITSGILLALFAFLAPSALPKSRGITIGFILFAIFYGLGTVATGYFPCDYGCPADADVTLSQFIHNTAGFLTYAVTPICLIGLGAAFRKFPKTKILSKISIVCGTSSLIFVLFLFGNLQGSFIGLFQRIIEMGILTWVVCCSLYLVGILKN